MRIIKLVLIICSVVPKDTKHNVHNARELDIVAETRSRGLRMVMLVMAMFIEYYGQRTRITMHFLLFFLLRLLAHLERFSVLFLYAHFGSAGSGPNI